MNQTESILLEMSLHKAIDQQMDMIVQAALKVAKLLQGGAMRENQLRNVLDSALHSESLELVANFIRYQIGRSSDWQRKDFGEQVIATFAQDGLIGKIAKLVTTQVKETGVAEEEKEILRRAHLHLTRRFLGELNRAFLYADRTNNWEGLNAILEG